MIGVLKIKTLVELFDICQLENVIAGLKLCPEKIIYVGLKAAMSKRRQNSIVNFYKKKGINAEISFEDIKENNLQDAIDKINSILDNNEDCYFDLTGGSATFHAAVGAVSASREVKLFRFDVKKSKFVDVLNCRTPLKMSNVSMTINEALKLNGTSRVYSHLDIEWDLSERFKRDVDSAWNIICDNYGNWNSHTNAFNYILSHSEENEPLFYKFYGDAEAIGLDKIIMEELEAYGLISELEFESDKLSFRFKNLMIKQLLNKAGNTLEVMCYILLNEIKEELPGLYEDISVSVNVDWDGDIHSEFDSIKDTRNEIDVMVMTGVRPVFISCKNGVVKKEALYELSTAAKHYGGKYASMVLVSTKKPDDLIKYKYLEQRARDMRINLIDDMCKFTREGFKNALLKAVK